MFGDYIKPISEEELKLLKERVISNEAIFRSCLISSANGNQDAIDFFKRETIENLINRFINSDPNDATIHDFRIGRYTGIYEGFGQVNLAENQALIYIKAPNIRKLTTYDVKNKEAKVKNEEIRDFMS